MQTRYTHLEQPAVYSCNGGVLTAASVLDPVFECAEESASLLSSISTVSIGETLHELPKFLLLGERGGGIPIRLGLFSGLDAGQFDTIIALSRLLLQLELSPILAQDFAIFATPVTNLAGFSWEMASLSEFQARYAAEVADGDVRYFQEDFAKWRHDGLIFLRSNGVNAGFSATTRSHVLANEVVLPALQALSPAVELARQPVKVLPQSDVAKFADWAAGRLLPRPETRPWPFEIELFAPADAPCEVRVRALFLAVVEILRRYRAFVAHAGTL